MYLLQTSQPSLNAAEQNNLTKKQSHLIGLMLGQYEIVSLVGKGGMATVYRGVQKSISRTVAIKILPRNFTHDDTFMNRFRREAETVAQLEHPHIMPIYDYGEYDDMPYIVMRYVDGGSVHDRIRKNDLTFDEIAQIIRQVGSALDYAHKHQVLHRDVKPSNVLLDSHGNAYLTDFGLARLGEGTNSLTGSNIVGTPAYMAPEQAEQGPQAPPMDIYSLGVTLYEMLTGQIPFTAETPIAQILMHVQRPVPSVRVVNPSVPIEADQVVKRSMAKRPSDRYSTATLLAEALEAGLLQREPAHESEADTIMSPGTRSQLPDVDFIVESDPITERMERAPEAPTPPFIRPLIDTSTPGSQKTEVLPYAPHRRRVITRRQAIIGLISLAVLVIVGSVIAASRGGGGPATPTTIAAIPSTTSDNVAVIPSETNEPTITEPPTETTTESATITASPTTEVTQPPTEEVTPTAEISPTSMPPIIVQSGTDMILIPESPFMMGSRVGLQDEGPVHEVFLDSYYIDRNEVTIGGYKHCVDAGACPVPEVVRSRTRFIYYGPPEYDVYPVANVTWQEAEAFCEWRGSNLPTEAQWEKAARWDNDNKEAREFPWGTNAVDGFFLNFGGTRIGDTTGVGKYPPGRSWYGVNDMSGNVAEWVYDWFSEDFYSITPYANPIGPESGIEKVYRGGSYASFGAELRSAARQHGDPDTRNEAVGFRCAYNPNGFPMP